MVKKIFYQSSLPRAGSTIFQNIMGQNPDFYVTPTSGLIEFIYTARNVYSDYQEFKAQDQDIMKKAFIGFCKEGMYGYFNAITEKNYVLDKSRGWGIHYDLLNMILPDPKIICVIRDPRDVFNSLEKKYRANPDRHLPGLIDPINLRGTTVVKRVEAWASGALIGIALDRISDSLSMGTSKHMLFLKYEDLCLDPESTMITVYNYLNLPYFDHDFDNIEQITQEDDQIYGIFGDHKIRNNLELTPSTYKKILGEDVSNWIYYKYEWFYDTFNYSKD